MANNRRRSWSDQRFAGTVVVAGARQRFDLLENAPVADTMTVVRIIGDLTFMYDVTGNIVDSLSIVDVGIGVAGSVAFTGNMLPDLSLETEYPDRGWIYIASLPVAQHLDGVGGASI